MKGKSFQKSHRKSEKNKKQHKEYTNTMSISGKLPTAYQSEKNKIETN